MTRQAGIWSRLREYEITPPQGVADRIWGLVNMVLPEETGRKDDGNGDEQINGSLEKLSQVAIQPPPVLRSSIEGAIRKIPVRSSVKSYSFYGIRSVAACLILALAGWLIYRATLSKGSSIAALDKRTVAESPAGKDAAAQQTDSLSRKDSLAVTDSLNALAGNLPAEDSNVLAKAGRYRQHSSFHINGQSLPLVDNDLLVTFASFKYNEIADFISRNDNESWNIRVDQYANIVISKTMAGMMKEMSEFKSNGNPTRKARKSREKLNKWKKTDEINFDQSLKKNPLDPIDLAEFIFK